MYHFFTASKDASIYQNLPNLNTGRDEILEVSKDLVDGSFETSRFLIQFNTAEISSSIASGEVSMSLAELVLKECQAEEVPLSYVVEGYPVSQSWDMGTGWRYMEYSYGDYTTGVTWNYASVSSSQWDTAGGDYIVQNGFSQSVEYLGYDLTFDVSASLNDFISGSLTNYGWIFKMTDAVESDGNSYGRLQFFSKETNTIYQPKIRIGWNDQVFNTGSLSALTASPIYVTVKGLAYNYKVGSKPIIRVFGREKYPLKTYTNQYQYDDVKYLPSTTYYEVKDAVTHEVIVPYSEYTKVSCDSNGNYLTLNLVNWEVNREYYINFKVDRSGAIEYSEDKNLTFKVIE
jgi:hypothetical protein